jgi:hypothetical protein
VSDTASVSIEIHMTLILDAEHREHRVLRLSFWIKLVFVMVELALAACFIGTTFTRHYDIGAVFEWVIAFIFSLYIFSFAIDLYPAVHTKPQRRRHFSYNKSPRSTKEGSSSGTLPSSRPPFTSQPTHMDRVPANF